jgi:hypothetical protein
VPDRRWIRKRATDPHAAASLRRATAPQQWRRGRKTRRRPFTARSGRVGKVGVARTGAAVLHRCEHAKAAGGLGDTDIVLCVCSGVHGCGVLAESPQLLARSEHGAAASARPSESRLEPRSRSRVDPRRRTGPLVPLKVSSLQRPLALLCAVFINTPFAPGRKGVGSKPAVACARLPNLRPRACHGRLTCSVPGAS